MPQPEADCTYVLPALGGMLPMIKRQWPAKASGDDRGYLLDFSRRLSTREAIVQADTWINGPDAALLLKQQANGHATVGYRLSGGMPGQVYTISTRIVTSSGDAIQTDVPIQIGTSPAMPAPAAGAFSVNGAEITYGGQSVTP